VNQALYKLIRDIPDFPKPGILFKDITPLVADPQALSQISKKIANLAVECDFIAGIEARGFIFAAAAATLSGKGFIPIRKQGKLPGETHSRSYDLEYGQSTLEIHSNLIPVGSKVLLVDDVLATGGTAIAAAKLLQDAGLLTSAMAFVIEIPELNGRTQIATSLAQPKISILLAQ
jgi:adenine phosphoribosyltransferase